MKLKRLRLELDEASLKQVYFRLALKVVDSFHEAGHSGISTDSTYAGH